MFPEPTELLLIGCSIESIWTPRSKSNTWTPRTNSQTYWQKEISHVTSGIIFCVCSTLAISVLPLVLKWCQKEHKKNQVKKESQQNQSWWWICFTIPREGSERACLDCIGKPGENQIWKSERTSGLVKCAANKNGETRIGRQLIKLFRMEHWRQVVFSSVEIWWNVEPVFDKFVLEDDMDSDTATESNLSLRSRSFLNRVNDRLRKMLDQSSKDAPQDIDKRSMIWWMFMSSTVEASVFIGGQYSENVRSIKNPGNNITMKQMFDISEKLIVGQSEEIYGVTPINWEDLWRKQFSLVMKKSSVSRTRRFTYYQILCYALERCTRIHNQILSGKTSWRGSRVHHNTELWTQLTESRWNSSEIVSQDSPHCSSATKSKSSCLKWAINQKNSKMDHLHVDVQRHLMGISRQWTGMRI